MLHSVKELQSYEIQANDGDIGKVRGFYFNDQTWEIHYLVVDTNKWLPGRKVLVSPAVIHKPSKQSERLPIDLSKEKIEESPAIEEDVPIARSFTEELNAYYGWRMNPDSTLDADDFEDSDGDLRSTYEVTGFYVEAADGAMGHVEDFIIDDQDWTIKYLVIDTQNWFFGKKVLVSVGWIESIGWDDEKLYIDLTMEEIKQSPEFDSDKLETLGQSTFYGQSGDQTHWPEQRP
jgi:uncharacterized protein YrrD